MIATHAPQPKSASGGLSNGTSWTVAYILAGGGAALLAMGFYMRLPKVEAGCASCEREIAQLKLDLTSAEAELAKAREAGKGPAADLKRIEDEMKAKSERIAFREGEVKRLEEIKQHKVGELNNRIVGQAGEVEKEAAQSKQIDTEVEKASKANREFLAALAQDQNTIVTIASSKGTLGTGFLINGFKYATILTTKEVAPAGAELLVKLRDAEGTEAEGTATVAYTDAETGLAFLSLATKEEVKLRTLDVKSVRDPNLGEIGYAIVTELHGAEMFQVGVFHGAISKTDYKYDDRKVLQLQLAANFGSGGSPILDGDRRLIGVLLAHVEGLEKVAVAIPATDIAKAKERLKLELKKKK